MTKRKRIAFESIVCIGLLCIVCSGYFVVKRYLDEQIVPMQDDFSWVFQVDSVETGKGEILVKGFAFELDKDAVGDNFTIVLHNIETGENYFLKTRHFLRKDVNDYFLCEYDYLQSGFEARISEKRMDFQKNDYEVFLRMKGEKKTYQTGIYFVKGQLAYANPKEFIPLNVSGTDLEEVIEDGVLRVYRPNEGMYIYQFNGELYWIAESKYGTDNSNEYIQLHVMTTQNELLPKERLVNGWLFDNLGFDFLSNEQKDLKCGEYRVAKVSIPTAYAVKELITGYVENDWIWRQVFRPYYVFEDNKS